MKTYLMLAAMAVCGLSASAQAIESPSYFSNWSLGVEGGVATPMTHHSFFESMRPVVGLSLSKQITPAFAMGVEGQFGINTSSWTGRQHSSTTFDDSYVGLFGAADLCYLFGGWDGNVRPFTIEAVAGAGWGHQYLNKAAGPDQNYFATKAGLNFNFNVSPDVTLKVSPSVVYNMSGVNVGQTSAAYDANKAAIMVEAGVVYHMGGRNFTIVEPYNQAEVDMLNAQVNGLRAQLGAALADGAALQAANGQLAAALADCQSQPAKVVVQKETEINNYLNSVRFVFFKIGSSTITPDQQPNVEMIADYMKAHPEATLTVKGYASKDGNLDFNIALAKKRAEAVKDMLVNRYKIAASRITAEGEGIGEMFEVESWNRVSICILNAQE